MAEVARLIKHLNLPAMQLERIKTGVAEATMNAMEHGNHYLADIPVQIKVKISKTKLNVQIVDLGSGPELPEPEMPDLEANLAGLQSPRGWGLFIIQNMIDELRVSTTEEGHHRQELIFTLQTLHS